MRLQPARGYFAIGIESSKSPLNVGTLWRSAYIFGAAFIFTIGKRYPNQPSDTLSTPNHVPLYEYPTFEFFENVPRALGCRLVGVELDANAIPLASFDHPEQVVYLLGAEDYGLSDAARRACDSLVVIPGHHSVNVAVAGSIVMADNVMYPNKLK